MKVSFQEPEKVRRTMSHSRHSSSAFDLDAMLAQEIEELNRDTEEDRRVKEAVIVAKRDPNKIVGPDDEDDSSEEGDSEGDYDEDDYFDEMRRRDPELYQTTQNNRQIAWSDADTNDTSVKKKTAVERPPELVFSDPPTTITTIDRIVVTFHYGVSEERTHPKSRKYMMTCDFGEESMYAMNWAMGTMLRDGDQVHLVSIVSPEDDLENLDDNEKYRLWQEMDRKSKTLISNVRSVLGDMLLFNIKICIYVIAGPTKESLLDLIYETPLTMVVCGSREKGALKGLLMGSVSTFLVHNSPVPVSVVRPQKKAKKSKKKLTAAQKLSQSVRNGQLKVDEAAGASSAPNVHML